MTSNFIFTSRNEGDTLRLGKKLGQLLTPGCVIGLTGDLGAGKTYFSKGIVCGVNKISENNVTSPTFTILQEYQGRIPLYHFDAYRLSGPDDLEAIGFYEYVNRESVSIIEWADRITTALPEELFLVDIEISGINERIFTFKALGADYRKILKELKEYLNTDRNRTENA